MFKNFNFDHAATKLFTAPVENNRGHINLTLTGTCGTDILDSQYGSSFLVNLDDKSAKSINELKPFDKVKLDGWTPKILLRYYEPKNQYSCFVKVKLYDGKISCKTNKELDELKDLKGGKITIKARVSGYFDPEKKTYGLYLIVEEFVFP